MEILRFAPAFCKVIPCLNFLSHVKKVPMLLPVLSRCFALWLFCFVFLGSASAKKVRRHALWFLLPWLWMIALISMSLTKKVNVIDYCHHGRMINQVSVVHVATGCQEKKEKKRCTRIDQACSLKQRKPQNESARKNLACGTPVKDPTKPNVKFLVHHDVMKVVQAHV